MSRRTTISRRAFAALLANVTLVPAALGQSSWPRHFEQADGPLTIAAPPKRVVSTSPSLTGILLAIDAPLISSATAVVGPLTDEQGFFRQWATIAHERGVSVLYPNLAFDIEALLAAEPDLTIASTTGGDAILPHAQELEALGLTTLFVDYSRSRWQDLARELGRATDREAQAERIISDFDARVAESRARLTPPDGSVSIVSYDFGGTYAVSKPTSAQASLLTSVGFSVFGLPEAMRAQTTRSSDFDFVSHENLSAAITGEGVFLLNGTEASVRTFMTDPMMANLAAVRNGQVWPLGPTSFRVDYYSGPQILETIEPYFRK